MSAPLPVASAAAAHDSRRRARLALALALGAAVLAVLGVMTGSEGWSWRVLVVDLQSDQAQLILGEIRLPRTLGAFGVGAMLGLAGALAQGLFRNPLADPYLIGSAAGAGLAIVLVLAASTLSGAFIGALIGAANAASLERIGLVLPTSMCSAQIARLAAARMNETGLGRA
ncbi:MAG: iron chelate uptake ABC transporter family permease subunit, partial [Burkholderiaceae bacterium]